MALRSLQSLLDSGIALSMVKVYAVAISFFHEAGERVSGRVLRAPSWNHPLVLRSLTQSPYELSEHADSRSLSQKTVPLLAPLGYTQENW